MSEPTHEQAAVLDANERVRIVRAAPGCGKTWLVAEAIRRIVKTWSGRGGIAALSFTNVGGEEIRRAVGKELNHPHFVGALDAFVYRYIVRQFAHILHPKLRQAKLVASDQAGSLKYDPRVKVSLPEHSSTPVSVFDLTFTGGFRDEATLVVRGWNRATSLSQGDCGRARAAKMKLWCDHHWMSHSDVTYIAAALLRDTIHGEHVRRFVADRFPVIVVDELQDTGWYLGEVIRGLLHVDSTRGLLVGDPDQAIFEFNGARPELFDTFLKIPGSREFAVRRSLRCPAAVTAVANHLRTGQHEVQPRAGPDGAAFLIVENDVAMVDKLRSALAVRKGGGIHNVVARNGATVDQLNGGRLSDVPEFSSRPITLAHDALRHLNSGRSRRAIECARGALLQILLGEPAASDALLKDAGINAHELRLAAASMLESTKPENAVETAWMWAERAKETMLPLISQRGWERPDGDPLSVKSPPKKLQSIPIYSSLVLPPSNRAIGVGLPAVRTVHGVKGETHDTTILYVPPAQGSRRCVSETWWSSDQQYAEERRIAFVAATRSRQDFVLCVAPATAKNLSGLHPDFVRCFKQITTDEFLARYS